MWDLEAEAARLNLVLDDLPMEEKAWDRAVNVAYRKAALRAHPDKHPPDQRDAAEANFKRKCCEAIEIEGTKLLSSIPHDDQARRTAAILHHLVIKETWHTWAAPDTLLLETRGE